MFGFFTPKNVLLLVIPVWNVVFLETDAQHAYARNLCVGCLKTGYVLGMQIGASLYRFYQYSSFILFSGQVWIPSMSSCPATDPLTTPNNLYIDIFSSLFLHYPNIANKLVTPPWIPGMDDSHPAFAFEGHSSGFSLTNISNDISDASCLHKEVTFSGHVNVRDTRSDGILFELAYSGGLEAGHSIYVVRMDAAAWEFSISYR